MFCYPNNAMFRYPNDTIFCYLNGTIFCYLKTLFFAIAILLCLASTISFYFAIGKPLYLTVILNISPKEVKSGTLYCFNALEP